MAKPLISVVINCRNEAESLDKCLKSVKKIASEIIVVDMHSTDASVKVANKYHAKVFSYRWLKVVEPARNFALSKATGTWILLLDPDEYLTKELRQELVKITHRPDVDFVKIPRKNIIFNKWLKHSHAWPDYLIRFFRRGAVTWNRQIHSQPQTTGNGLTLLDSDLLAIRHNNYPNLTSFVLRANRYASVRAEELITENYKLKTSDFMLRPVQEFNSRFFASQGYKDGLHGLLFSLLQAFSILMIYLKIWEKQGFPDKSLPKESFVSASQEAIYEYGFWFSRYFFHEYSKNPFKFIVIKARQLLDRLSKNF